MQVGSYSYEPNAFKFGNGPYSFSMVQIPTRNLWHRNFNIRFDFRTFYPDGFLFASPVSLSKFQMYTTFQIILSRIPGRNQNIMFIFFYVMVLLHLFFEEENAMKYLYHSKSTMAYGIIFL